MKEKRESREIRGRQAKDGKRRGRGKHMRGKRCNVTNFGALAIPFSVLPSVFLSISFYVVAEGTLFPELVFDFVNLYRNVLVQLMFVRDPEKSKRIFLFLTVCCSIDIISIFRHSYNSPYTLLEL